MSLAATLAAAVVIGLLLGLLGGGGSILTLPVLIYLAGQAPQPAIAASLFVVAVTGAAALIPHARAGRVQWRTGLAFGTAGLVGSYAAGSVAMNISPSLLLTGFGLLLAFAAAAMIRACRRPPQQQGSRRRAAMLALGFTVGAVTGLVGAGGGFVIVPVLVLLAGLSMTAAVGTSLLVITLQATAGLAGHLPHTTIDWPVTLAVTVIAVAGSFAGARLAGRVNPRLLRTGFGWFLAAMSALMVAAQAPAALRHHLAGTAAGRTALALGATLLALTAIRHMRACRTLHPAQQKVKGSAPSSTGNT